MFLGKLLISMRLFWASASFGVFLFLLGLFFLWPGACVNCQKRLRSPWGSRVFFGLALVWFLIKILNLGEADYGQYRNLLFAVFGSMGVAAFFVIPDFLAVRGMAILTLLSAQVLLDAAFMQDPQSRLFLVGMVYLWIVMALYLGALPFRLRDALQWLWAKRLRAQALGVFFVLYGGLLMGLSWTYRGL